MKCQGHFIGHVDLHGVPYKFALLGLSAAKFVVFRESHDAQAFTDGERAHANIRNASFPHGLFESQHGFRVSWRVLVVIGASGVAACVQVKIIPCEQGFHGLVQRVHKALNSGAHHGADKGCRFTFAELLIQELTLNNARFRHSGESRAWSFRYGELPASGVVGGHEDGSDRVFLLFGAEGAHGRMNGGGVALSIVVIHEFSGRKIQVFLRAYRNAGGVQRMHMARPGHVAKHELRAGKFFNAFRQAAQCGITEGFFTREDGLAEVVKVKNVPARFPIFAGMGGNRPCHRKAVASELDKQAFARGVGSKVCGIEYAPVSGVSHV